MGEFLSETITCMLSLPDYLRASLIWYEAPRLPYGSKTPEWN